MAFNVYIPARFAASRLPGKPLLDVAGEPLIQRVYRAARGSAAANVVVVTDDVRIGQCAGAFGASVCMTGPHASGTDRIAEAATLRREADDAIIVNLQGDEPLMPPSLLDQVARLLVERTEADIATLYVPLTEPQEILNPNNVKVVCDEGGRALYFSRAPIPWDREHFPVCSDLAALTATNTIWFKHIGLYAYRVKALKRFAALPLAPIENAEKLEQLRALWHGMTIVAAPALQAAGIGVDTQADLENVRKHFTQPQPPEQFYGPNGEPLPTPPKKPDAYECCGRGCERCVYVYYEEALLRWRDKIIAMGADPAAFAHSD